MLDGPPRSVPISQVRAGDRVFDEYMVPRTVLALARTNTPVVLARVRIGEVEVLCAHSTDLYMRAQYRSIATLRPPYTWTLDTLRYEYGYVLREHRALRIPETVSVSQALVHLRNVNRLICAPPRVKINVLNDTTNVYAIHASKLPVSGRIKYRFSNVRVDAPEEAQEFAYGLVLQGSHTFLTRDGIVLLAL